MQFARRIARILGTVVLAMIAATAVAVGTGWFHITPVLSGSMRGAFNPGDALLTQRVAADSLHVGDVVDVLVPASPGQPPAYRVHRIVRLTHRNASVAIRTKGDANAAVDPGTIVLHGEQYVMRARLPWVGWIVDFKAVDGMRVLLEAVAALALISVGQSLWHQISPKSHRTFVSGTAPAG